jgi:hypothetical protein
MAIQNAMHSGQLLAGGEGVEVKALEVKALEFRPSSYYALPRYTQPSREAAPVPLLMAV